MLIEIITNLSQFIRQQSTSSFLLLLCAAIALVLANSGFSEQYLHLIHAPLAISLGTVRFELSLQHWINEALMSFFFLLVGLELKRELLLGELADRQRAALPAIAAIGGMVIPAALYWLWNPSGITKAGWGIPMATDIAFAIGALSALGKRISPTLATFLIALAIVDDIGAVLVIACFYTEKLHTEALLISVLLTAILIAFNLSGIRRLTPYLLVGVLLWCAMLNSGIHATLAGIVLAFTIPTSPAQYLEHRLHVPVAFFVVPLFALTNAAIPIHWNAITNTFAHPVTLGVISGLMLGKWLGITSASWLAIKTGIATLPSGLSMRHIHGIGLLAGIGFTMSIFVADLAFTAVPELLLMAKTGILIASITSAVFGYCWLRFACNDSRMPP